MDLFYPFIQLAFSSLQKPFWINLKSKNSKKDLRLDDFSLFKSLRTSTPPPHGETWRMKMKVISLVVAITQFSINLTYFEPFHWNCQEAKRQVKDVILTLDLYHGDIYILLT